MRPKASIVNNSKHTVALLKQTLIGFPGFALRDGDELNVHIQGWAFRFLKSGTLHSLGQSLIRRFLELPKQDPRLTTAYERSKWFIVDNLKKAKITFPLSTPPYVTQTQPNGHFKAQFKILTPRKTINRSATRHWIKLQWKFQNQPQTEHTWVQILDDDGISIISDIDDTIKISEVHSSKLLLQNTFTEKWEAVPHMHSTYQWLAQNHGASFLYVSASPWQLYKQLENFRIKNKFPPGIYKLKDFRWKDKTLVNLFRSPEKLKLNAIKSFIRQFKNRKFILIGDSGEKDAEIYKKIQHLFPDRIIAVAIRNLPYKPVSKSSPSKNWFYFESGSDLRVVLEQKLGAHSHQV